MVAIVMTVLLHHMTTPAIMHQGTLTVGYVETILRRVMHADADTVTSAQVGVVRRPRKSTSRRG